MRAKSNFLRRLGAVALACGIAFGTLASAQPVSAAEKFQVTETKYEKEYQFDDGKPYYTAKGAFPEIKEDTEAAKKINRELKKEKNMWIKNSKQEAADAKTELGFILSDETIPAPEWTCSNDLNYEVTSNDGKYFSVLMSGYFFSGGAHGSPYRVAMTFDAQTGQKLTAVKLFGTSKAKLNAKVRNLYLKKYDQETTDHVFYGEGDSGRAELKKALSTMNFNKAFYVKDGEAVFYAEPYALGPYAAGFIEVSATVK